MSSVAASRKISKRSTRAAGIGRSKASLSLDLNLLPAEQSAPEAAPALSSSAPPAIVLPNAGSHVIPIDVERAADDEVQLLTNPRSFPKTRSRRRTQSAVDVEATGATVGSETNSSTVRQKKHGKFHPNGLVINCDEEDLGCQCGKKAEMVVLPPQPIVIYKERSLTCPVCWSELVEASSTICGHIFCAGCIKLSIQKRKECPTCCRKLSMSNFHRVFLPNST